MPRQYTKAEKVKDVSLQDIDKVLHLLPQSEQELLLHELDKLEDLRAIESVKKNFLEYVRRIWPIFIAGKHHKIMAEAFERIARGELKRLIINMPPRHPYSLDTPILTTCGWRTIGTVEPGDYVYAPDGRPVLVKGASPVRLDTLWEVRTTDGHVIECTADHLWTVSSRSTRQFFKTVTTEQLSQKTGVRYLPDFSPIQGEHKDLPIDPYVLGVWLGDGDHTKGHIACSTEDSAEMRRMIEERGYETTDRKCKYVFGAKGLLVDLRAAGLLGNKHIPEIYFNASIEQREALLQGLIDTDGSVGLCGRVTFHQTRPELTRQVRALICGLGVRCGMTRRKTPPNHLVKKNKPSYRLSFRHPRAARLSRKAARLRGHSQSPGRTVSAEKTTRTGLVRCIEVDNPEGLFLVGEGMVVGHNTKSEFGSWLLPSWYLGLHPHKKVIQCSNTADLATGFGRKVRDTLASDEYQEIFTGTSLKADSKAAGHWLTNKNGEYFAIGVGGVVTGKGADLLIIDDPHSEQEAALAAANPEIYDKVYEWYTSGPRQRLQPNAAIVIIQTRWSLRDLTGRVLQSSVQRGGDEWELIEFPAELPSGKTLWPEFWSYEELMATKSEIDNAKWMAQYQQQPTSEEAAIIKRGDWRLWNKDEPPEVSFVLQSWDTAFEKTTRADYSALTTWGVFYHPDDAGRLQPNLILLHAMRARMEFPKLKQVAMQEYNDWTADEVLIEKKASGAPLLYELRMRGVPATEYVPIKDKITRLNAVAPVFAAGKVWAPNRQWAEEVMDELAAFPSGDFDDYVDSVSMAIQRFRKGGFVSLDTDHEPEPKVVLGARNKLGYHL